MGGGVVALWDVRVAGDRGCAAAIQMAEGGASWVHLDEGQGFAGQLLLLPCNGANIQVYDVRRVASARHPSSAVPVSSLPSPARGVSVSCFASEGSTLVVGGGHKSGESWRYRVAGHLLEDEGEEEDGVAASGSKQPTRIKPPRSRNAPAQCFKRTSRPQ
mmetsp:Transcript_25944/g.59959  ORF Transcript_25944/g.59959 Transcript_25944/m.59959 type:complete len:160 (-) Transcript_25944:86-565(-)